MKGPYPEIQGGGSLILAWQIRNKRVLVVGGGEVRHHPYDFLQSIDG
jgi:precorrin-2 dehydrogenase/sirohydrochlorin ferrochelatase